MNLKGYIRVLALTLYGSLMHGQQVLDTICVNANSVTHLAVSHNPLLGYQWTINGGQIIGRSDTSDVEIQWGAIPGLYLSFVVAYDYNGCIGDTSAVYMYLKGSVVARAKGPNVVCEGSVVTLSTPLITDFEWTGGKKKSTISFVAERDTSIMLIALNGRCGNDTTWLNIYTVDIPKGAISPVKDTLQLNEMKRLYYTGNPADFIDWYVNGQLVSQTNNVLINFDQVGEYEVTQITRNGSSCADTVKKTIYVVAEFTVFIPNAFTPNGDGVNDLFTFDGIGIKSFTAEVYNRWGEKVYEWNENSSLHGWDGTNSGQQSKMDTYVYKIIVRDQLGKEYYFYDSFNLIR